MEPEGFESDFLGDHPDGGTAPVPGTAFWQCRPFEGRLRQLATSFASEPGEQDSASAVAIDTLEFLRRELDSTSAGAEDRCALACGVLLESKQSALLKAVGWDLLHSFLPFVAEPAVCANAAQRLLKHAASVCNPRELFSMVMEAFVFFKVRLRKP